VLGRPHRSVLALSDMIFLSHLRHFLRVHVFSWRILRCNVLNMIFWIFVFTGCSYGLGWGIVPCFIGLVLGALAGTCFLALCYLAYHRRRPA
jgi:hypothetical protein